MRGRGKRKGNDTRYINFNSTSNNSWNNSCIMGRRLTEAKKEYHRLYMLKYRQTEKYKAYHKWYTKTAKRRAWLRSFKAKMRLTEEGRLKLNQVSREYRKTEKYKKYYAKYSQLPRVKESGRLRARLYRMRKREANALKKELKTTTPNSTGVFKSTYQGA